VIENWGLGKEKTPKQQLFAKILAFCRGFFSVFLKKQLLKNTSSFSFCLNFLKEKYFQLNYINNFNGEFFTTFIR